MTALNKQALRKLAKALSGKEWVAFVHKASGTYAVGSLGHERGEDIIKWPGFDGQDNAESKAKFIAAASPSTMLELMDELESEKNMREAAEKRIAELESNEIREEGNQFLVVRHPGKTPVINHLSGDPEEFLRNLIEQDPLVTIDIITHRYYGVGGQWVQDADEYLHMMTAAGIGVKGE
ncbi:TPA_asm: ead/Ea22-like family protein [Salmonella enterica subsp. enterica serovar Typhimurium]|uniref:Ead/Ea22-like family protein n=1 Tax=Salmonella typhimurium TaxID=90371 RepID=A0A8E6N5A3_SALTM|nr:ead/Ea22-like family protein [Salmonella enterica]MBL6175106.1 ead/Ea22-like family protein [Salmonella enterica subsp. enterica serovar Typhimurium]QVP91816.1 ead/Ea22-like family protein [Salmonella enterica subsp. enterica serovar Typhimurium]HAE3813906.1 ead/Ea22-like family protein [Salmonella enterica subsp. enterica serovar Typhimurium]HAE8638435.1 ead/Ea22-like family protein [Salmonella enterica subsp. enterica serovar Typhimurium]